MKKQNLNKLLALALAAVMSASLLTACGNKTDVSKESEATQSSAAQSSETQSSSAQSSEVIQESSSEAVATDPIEHDPLLLELGAEPFVSEEVTITIALKSNTNIEDYDTNYLTTLLEETSGVNIEFLLFPSASKDADSKLQMMLVGEETLPDIILWGLNDATAQNMGEEGYIIPLEDYFEYSSYYAKNAFAKVEEQSGISVTEYQTGSDGHIWQFPAYQDSPSTAPGDAKIWVYRPWLEALNLEKPTTTEEFKEMLLAFKTQDPNGNGKADEIPLVGSEIGANGWGSTWWRYLMNAFVHTSAHKDYLISTDGKISVSYTEDGWKNGIKYMRTLVEEKLVDPVSFTQSQDSFTALLNGSGDQIVGAFAYTSPSFIGADHPSKQQWELLEPLTGPDGFCSTQWDMALPSNKASITTDCEHPEIAFRLLDLMCREDIGITNRWGKQGENWEYVEKLKDDPAYKDKDFSQSFSGYPAYFYEMKNIWKQVQNIHWQATGPYVNTIDVVAGWYATSMDPINNNQNTELGQHLGAYQAVRPDEPIAKIYYNSLEDQETAELLKTELLLYVHEKVANWLMGVGDVESEWNAYLTELEALGVSDYLEIIQAGWMN